MHHRLDHYRFTSFLPRYVYDLAVAYLAYQHSAGISLSSVGMFPCFLLYYFADSRAYALKEAVVRSRESGVIRALGDGNVLPAKAII